MREELERYRGVAARRLKCNVSLHEDCPKGRRTPRCGCGTYIGTLKDYALAELLSDTLAKELRIPLFDCSPYEEEGYGLPEFSIYYNYDARSWCGRWTYSDAYCGFDDLLLGLTRSEIEEVEEVEDGLNAYLERPNHAVAVLVKSALLGG